MGEGVLGLPSKTLLRIAGAVGTPAYVYDAGVIRQQYAELTEALGNVPNRVFYSVKANSTRGILDLVRSLGAGVDIVSGGELARSLRAGFAPEDIVFSGVGKSVHELEEAVSAGIRLINVESFAELQLLADVASAAGAVCNVGIRVNPDVAIDSHPYIRTGHAGLKFGVPLTEVNRLAEWAAAHGSLRFGSIGMHIGSQIADACPYREGAERLVKVIEELAPAARSLDFVSVGGGLGIRYTDEAPLRAADFAAAVRPLWDAVRIPVAVEPGRFLVGNAGCLLATCLYVKRSGTTEFAVVDAGMNDFLRASLYGAKHALRVVAPSPGGGGASGVDALHVVGPICESGDSFGVHTGLQGVGPGAVLALLGAGAYGFSMSSTYNSRPRVPEVLVEGDEWCVIRERETVDDLMRGERVARFPATPREEDG